MGSIYIGRGRAVDIHEHFLSSARVVGLLNLDGPSVKLDTYETLK